MEADVHFGDLEESEPDTSLRPDQNKQFAVVAIDGPEDRDLPVYVDLDVMADMEDHALEDTSVELGGVMLGGHFLDQDGKPFVVISDSLRAKHYESTKGSFKFTHDTWSEITKEREEFPDDLQMVGWYHTHPDWGVFLSGMDMFICDNFFNKELDVALVIDPCRDDRGMFQWTGDPANRIRRAGGFYLISSRFRLDELEDAADQLSGGGGDMAMTRMRSSGGGNQPTVVQIPDSNSWQGTAVMGMMTMQFLLVLLVAVKLMFPSIQIGNEKIDELEAQVARLSIAETNRIRDDAQNEMLDDLMARMGDGKKAFSGAVKAKEDAAQWKASALGQSYHVKTLNQRLAAETVAKKKSMASYDRVSEENKVIRAQRDRYRKERDGFAKKLNIDVPSDDTEPREFFGIVWYWWAIGGGLLFVLGVGTVMTTMTAQKEESPYRPDEDEEQIDDVNFDTADDDASDASENDE